MRGVVDDAKLMAEAMTLARRLADGPTRALVATRALVEESEHASYEAQFRREIELQAEIRTSADAIEGPQGVRREAQGEVHGEVEGGRSRATRHSSPFSRLA